MNSISGSLNAETIVATARMLRSAKKEILLVVEGDDDIALFSHALGLPRSNFISCFGKERLMEVFELVPRKGLDEGTILVRDADHDGITNQSVDGVLLLTSDLYDFEMSLLPRRVFGRIFMEFLKTKSSPQLADSSFKKLTEVSGFLGALRLVSHQANLNIDFKEPKLSFIDQKDMSVDLDKMIAYFISRSKISVEKTSDVIARVRSIVGATSNYADLSSGKDFLRILSLALSRHYKCCNSSECTIETLSRMFRITVTHDDIRELAMYPLLSAQVAKSGMKWTGFPL